MLWVGVLPSNWFGVFVVLTDVAHDFLVQVLGAGEDAARDHFALDLGKPDFHLVKPRRVGGRVVNMHIGCQQQLSLDQDRLVAAHVVADHMDFLVFVMIGHDIFQEPHELLTGVTLRRLAHDFASGRVQGCEQAQRSIALVLKAMTLGASRRQWQLPVLAIQRLNGGLLVDTEHDGMFGWLQVQTDDLGRLALKVWIIRDHVGIQPVGAHAVLAPDALHRTEGDISQLGCQFATAPVGGAVTRLGFEGAIQHPGFELGDGANGCASWVMGYQSGQPSSCIGPCPTADEAVVTAQRQSDVNAPRTRGTQQHAACPARKRRIARLLAHHALQLSLLLFVQFQRCHASRYRGYTVNFNDSIY